MCDLYVCLRCVCVCVCVCVFQEARALGELEEKLRSSRQLLSSKEQDLRQLHSFLTQVFTPHVRIHTCM